MSKIKNIIRKMREEFLHTTETLWKNEVNANIFVAQILVGTAVIDLIIMLLGYFNVFTIERRVLYGVLLRALFELLIPALACFYYKGQKRWLKTFMLLAYTVVLARIESVLMHNVTLCMVFPTVLSIRYYSRSVTAATAFLTTLLSGIADYVGVVLRMGRLDMNMIGLPAGTVLTFDKYALLRDVVTPIMDKVDINHLWMHTLQHFYLPKLFLFSMVAVMAAVIAQRGRETIFEQQKETQKTERISTELNLARDIQANMLPNIFPPFPERKEFDIYATMTPAKEVGGDFYDFYMIDEDHLAMVIADVSGKGIPAAMLMMASKIMIKNFATLRADDPGIILENVNYQITKNNPAEMFVTCWLGILELSTGILKASNAGHEYPCIKRKNGKYEMIRDRHGLVLGAMDMSKYSTYELKLEEGDSLFVYTDGVTEATNKENELFGNDRLVDALNNRESENVIQVIDGVALAIDDFVQDAPQFDDITMLALHYNGEKHMDELTIEATIDNIPTVTAFVDEKLEKLDCPIKAQSQIDIAIDELFSNIAKFAYHPETGPATVKIEVEENPMTVIITFIDHGQPYDPLKAEDPDIHLDAENREVGGLGVYLVKKTMDDVTYEYKDGKNILRIKKKI